MKQKQRRNKTKERDSKPRKRIPQNKETNQQKKLKPEKEIRRVKGHLTWPLNPPPKTKKPKSWFFLVQKRPFQNAYVLFKQKRWNLLGNCQILGHQQKHKMRTECAKNRFKPP